MMFGMMRSASLPRLARRSLKSRLGTLGAGAGVSTAAGLLSAAGSATRVAGSQRSMAVLMLPMVTGLAT